MKVLHLINNLNREGAQVMLFNLVTFSSDKLIQHLVWARKSGGPLQSALEKSGISVFAARRNYGVLATRRSVRLIEEVIENETIDLIHAHMADAAFLGWLAARKRDLPLLITHHGHNLVPECGMLCRGVYTLLLAAAARHARKNVAVSPSVAERVRRGLALEADRVCTITNGVPIPTKDKLAKRCARGPSELRVVTVGRLVELKGQDQLIAAAAILVKQYQDARFFIVGDGPLGERLREHVRSSGLCKNVIFTGSVDNVADFLCTADIYVSTSHYEGMPIAALEAMAWNVPVVASDVPGNRGIVVHGETGLLYQLGDVHALVHAIERVIADPESAKKSTQRAFRLAEERYSAGIATRNYERLYADSLGLETDGSERMQG